jgi:hypothetical protein
MPHHVPDGRNVMRAASVDRGDKLRGLLADELPQPLRNGAMRGVAPPRRAELDLAALEVPAGDRKQLALAQIPHPHAVDAVLDILGNSTVLDSLAMLRRAAAPAWSGFWAAAGRSPLSRFSSCRAAGT